MKLIIKIEIVILALVVLVAAGMMLVSEGFLELLEEPVIAQREPAPLPTDPAPVQEELVPLAVAEEQAVQPGQRTITAKKYFAYDVRDQEYLSVLGDPQKKLYPASITKLLSCRVLLSCMAPDEKITVGSALDLAAADSSVAELKKGDTLTVDQLVGAMMLPSGNDAAQVAAAAAGRVLAGDSALSDEAAVAAFVKEMNRQAQELGMANSHFVTPDGYHDDDHYTTMADLVLLCQEVLTDPRILKHTSSPKETISLPDRTLEWDNTNILLDAKGKAYLPSTIGLKTGYTGNAGSCLVSAFFLEDRVVLIGVFGCPRTATDKYLDTVAIYNSL